MSLKYLKHSDTQVQIYPSANRLMERDYKARLTDEFNVTNLANRVLDTNAFVITHNRYNDNGFNLGITNGVFEFSIKGYYFRVNDSDKILQLFPNLPNGGVIYANMYLGEIERNIPNSNMTYTSQTLLGIEEGENSTYNPTYLDEVGDVDTHFLGIGFSTELIEATNVYSLAIIMREDVGGNHYYRIPQDSKIKMQSTPYTDMSVKISDGIL